LPARKLTGVTVPTPFGGRDARRRRAVRRRQRNRPTRPEQPVLPESSLLGRLQPLQLGPQRRLRRDAEVPADDLAVLEDE